MFVFNELFDNVISNVMSDSYSKKLRGRVPWAVLPPTHFLLCFCFFKTLFAHGVLNVSTTISSGGSITVNNKGGREDKKT